jgi:cell division protein ZapE
MADVRAIYKSRVASGEIEADTAQKALVERLASLSDRLAERLLARKSSHLGWLFGSRERETALKGLYVWGDVGRGKTMLMDLFFEATTFRPKRRVHFHEFMAEVHDRITAARKDMPGDPIPHVADAMARKARLICFDELHVTDIADAMILGRLFKSLLEAQVVVVATSNVPPSELYKNGLNRPLFLPFIDLITQHMDVEELQAAKDFRLEKLAGRRLYFTPADAQAKAEMDRLWSELTGNHPGAPVDLDVKGHKVHVPLASMGVARFAFPELCARPLGANDFLHIAHTFHTLLIDGIPSFANVQRDVIRRFINLIDTLYDSRVCLISSAAAEPNALCPTNDMQSLFERTSSRLFEMRSQGYLTGRLDRLAAAAASE